ncbi:hypothetical protein [Marinomonas primoryensis]|uniref:Collagen-like protein n=1 Tax=Marinomonas primoryensis TaxID=178399 RepID=A0ABV0L1X8_9GAMM
MSNQLNIVANGIIGVNGKSGAIGSLGAPGEKGHDSSSKSKYWHTSCVPATKGGEGASGGQGGEAQNGEAGTSAKMVTFRAKSYSQNLTVNIELTGGAGGAGGAGGIGGAGGSGGAGGITSGSACKKETPVNGGNGGDGNNGGTGGNGGAGSNGGVALVQYQAGNSLPLNVSANVLGGAGGAGGQGGQGGAGGLGGQPGTNGDKTGEAGASGQNGLTGGGGAPGQVGSNGQQTVTAAEVDSYDQLVSQYGVPESNQYADLNGAITLDASATSGIVPFLTTTDDMDSMREMLGSKSVNITHMYEHACLQDLSTKSKKDLDRSEYHQLLAPAMSYLLGDTQKVASVKPLLNDTIAKEQIAIFAIKDVEIPAGGLSITTSEDGPNMILLVTEKISTGDISLSPMLGLTVNTDQLTGN